eukprot:SAG31_NODE_38208_length_298_cov_0.763819_1_plen_46_part_01
MYARWIPIIVREITKRRFVEVTYVYVEALRSIRYDSSTELHDISDA